MSKKDELPHGKFIIELPYKTDAQRKEADKYRKALLSGKPVLHKKVKCLVYHFSIHGTSAGVDYVDIGLVRAP